MKVADGIRGILTFFAIVIIAIGFVEFVDGKPLIPGLSIGSVNTIFTAIVIAILVNLAANRTVKEGEKKYRTDAGLMCPGCKDLYEAEIKQKKTEQRSEELRWLGELSSMMKADPSLGSIVKEWMVVNDNISPDRETIGDMITALNLEKAGNYEGAAKIFEKEKLWTQAGKAREKDRVQMVRHVTVDMNHLIDQIGTKGLAVPYKCHNCGASITIDKNSSASGLKFCSYCGTANNIEDMSKIVQEALSS